MNTQVTDKTVHPSWFAPTSHSEQLAQFGFRLSGGGAHLSKSMMVGELGLFLAAVEAHGSARAADLVEAENLLGKGTAAARESTFRQLNNLYGLTGEPPINRALRRLWREDIVGRPLLALLCALARDPLLRDTAHVVLGAPSGTAFHWPILAEVLEAAHPARFSPAMLKSLSQNCSSSWTQSGHLKGVRIKHRAHAVATPEAAAFAALLARRAGFGGPALVNSIWLAALDVGEAERMSLLRRAQGRGLVRVRQGGGVLEIEPSAGLIEGGG